jgi:hypothetical protein
LRVERRLQVGCYRAEALGAERVTGTAKRPEGGVDPSRRPKLLPGLGEGDRVPQGRLVLAPAQVSRCRKS